MIPTAIAPRSPLTLTPAPIASVAATDGGAPGDFAGSLAAMLETAGAATDAAVLIPTATGERQTVATTGKGLPDTTVADPVVAWLGDPVEVAPMPSPCPATALWPTPRITAAPVAMPVAAGSVTTSAALATSALTPVPAFAEPAPVPQPVAPNPAIRADVAAVTVPPPIARPVEIIAKTRVHAERATTTTTPQPKAPETSEKTTMSADDARTQTDRAAPIAQALDGAATPVVSPTPVEAPTQLPLPPIAADARPDAPIADTAPPLVRASRPGRAPSAAIPAPIAAPPLDPVVAPSRHPTNDKSASTDNARPRRDPAMPIGVADKARPATRPSVVTEPAMVGTIPSFPSRMIAPTQQVSDTTLVPIRAPAAAPVGALPVAPPITPTAQFVRAPDTPVRAAMPMPAPPATGASIVAQPAGAGPASAPAGSPTLQVAAAILSAMPLSPAQGAPDAPLPGNPAPIEQAPAPSPEPMRWSLPAATVPVAIAAAQASSQPQPQPQPGTVASAAQVFGAAMRAAAAPDERAREPGDGMASVLGLSAPQATAQVAAVTQAPLDMRHERWPEAMIARIEILRDAADANDTRIRLVPDALGAIDVSVKREGDTVHVHFAAEQAATRTLLHEAQPRLADLAVSRGLKLAQSSTGASVDGGQAGQQRQPATPQPRVPAAPPRTAKAADADTDSRLA